LHAHVHFKGRFPGFAGLADRLPKVCGFYRSGTLATSPMWEQSANKNWKCISSGIDERRAEPLWHFHDFGAVMQISRLDYLYILQTKCHFWHFANSLEDWPFGIII